MLKRLPNETHKAFHAFCTYARIEPRKRTLREAYSQCYGKDRAAVPGFFSKWAIDFYWSERAQKQDEDLANQLLDESRNSRKKAIASAHDALLSCLGWLSSYVKDAPSSEAHNVIKATQVTGQLISQMMELENASLRDSDDWIPGPECEPDIVVEYPPGLRYDGLELLD